MRYSQLLLIHFYFLEFYICRIIEYVPFLAWLLVRYNYSSCAHISSLLFCIAEVKCSESCSVMSDSLRFHGLHSPWNSLGQNTGVGSLSLLQGIFPTQGSNPGLSHCRWILYQLSHKGSPCIAEEDSILCCTTICISVYLVVDVGIVYILNIINKVAIKCMHPSFCISIHLSFG